MESTQSPSAMEMDAFLEANLFSFASWDLLAALASDPIALLTVTELANRLTRPEDEVRHVLARLAANGVVSGSAGADGTRSYCLTADSEIRRLVAHFVVLTSVRESRLELVRRVLSKLSVR